MDENKEQIAETVVAEKKQEIKPEVDAKATAEIEKLKSALSKANSEAAEWKRQFREKQTEAERAEAERLEREKAVEEELRTLRRDKSVSGFVAQYIAMGYDNALAVKAAEAMADGNPDAVLACQNEFLTNMKKELEAAALNKQPTLTTGAPPTSKQADIEAQNRMRSYFDLPPIK